MSIWSYFGLYPDFTGTNGKKAQAAQLTDPNGNIVFRQIGAIGDPADPLAVMSVKAASTASVIGDAAGVVALSPNSPLPTGANFIGSVQDTNNRPFLGVIDLTAGIAVTFTTEKGVGVLCTVAGNVTLFFPDLSSLTLPVSVGWQTFPFACVKYEIPGSGGATVSVYNLK